ncbi:MAG: hypothetical protein WC456_04135 [Patescibacteria group bacterium]
MATFNASFLSPEIREMQTYKDPESGCQVYNDRQAFELCKQSFYLKKQTAVVVEATNTEARVDNSAELQQLRTELAYLRGHVDVSQNFNTSTLIILFFAGSLFVIFLLLVLLIFKKIWKKI